MICLELFWTLFKIGAFTFGGGYAMLPLIQSEVESRGWLPLTQLVDFVAVSESTPGPFAVNIATYVGAVRAGLPGALCATLGVVLPSFVIILLVARAYDRFKTSPLLRGMMASLRPAVIGLIAAALLSLSRAVLCPGGASFSMFADPAFWASLCIFAVMLYLALRRRHPILLIGLSAAAGIAAGFALNLPVP